MAVLKDLIVHGPSRFINTAQFESLKTNKIGAEEGVFNKIVATTGDIGSLTVEDLTAGKATVLSLLDVRGELHTNQWTNSNIATIDGSFYITPTIGVNSGTMTTTANSVTVKGSNFPISSLYVNGINSDNTADTVAWTSGSKVLITGEILVNGTYMPLGTLVGVLDGDASATQIKIKSITDNRYQTAESLAEIGTQSTALPCRNVKVSLYQTSRGSTLYPLGIFMTALGENGKTFLDIYGGGYAASTATAGGFAKPVLRIGNLAGLPAVGGQNPTGYGIYTSNGYFTGTIVSTSGTIGNWSITSSSIQTGAFNTAGKMYFGNNGISLGTTFKVTSAGELTATSGTIGGITIGGTYLTTAAARKTYNATTAGLTITSTGIGAGNGTANTFKVVASTGALTASNATLTGGAIAGWTFNTTSLYKTNATPGYSADTMVISTGTKSTYNIGEGGTDEKTWMLSAGRGFGVTTAGKLYATGAVISGVLNITDPEASNIYTISAANEQIKNTQDTVDALRGEVATQAEDIASIQEQSQQFASNTDLQATRGIVDQYLGDNGAIKLDNTGILLSRGQFQLLITSQELDFLDAGQTVASLSNQALNITSAIITSNLTLGPFKWVVSTNRLTLMRI